MSRLPRRVFLMSVPTGCLAAAAYGIGAPVGGNRDSANTSGSLYPGFPGQNPKLVEEVVRYSHFDIDAVHELITDRPALAKASWDWGFGDWESALGAASHMGRRDMAELLITHGARPNMFTFAMFDQVDTLRAIVQANPGVQRIHGPHGITLLVHARNGKAERVIDYLESVEGAHVPQTNKPLDDEQKRFISARMGMAAGMTRRLGSWRCATACSASSAASARLAICYTSASTRSTPPARHRCGSTSGSMTAVSPKC